MTRRQTSGASSQVVRVAAGDAGVVDEDVDLADAPGRRRRPRRRRRSRWSARPVGADPAGAAPSVPLASASLPPSESHSATDGARGEHALGDGVADALRAAGDDGDAAREVDPVHEESPCQRRRRRPASSRQSAMYWRMMSAKFSSACRPRRAARSAVQPRGQLADDAGDGLVAHEAHPLAHRLAGHLLERVEHLGRRCTLTAGRLSASRPPSCSRLAS